ncbi:coiled-coil domain-containing protein 85C-A-like [Oppia nitens]|uniref:coiled-coil domain-containing protein 85C-A-like n=1 Tax=Oppia nitens TaxID=1686743 RepID=UPI0023D99A3A|nr:coiled-coil domain-containing protein 85C-A-like [Oppia nitens]
MDMNGMVSGGGSIGDVVVGLGIGSPDDTLSSKQRLRELMRENSEMKELILFLDDERNYAKLLVKEFNAKQLKTWNQMKVKLNLLETKQFDLIRENYSLKQLCVLLDTNHNSTGMSTPTLPANGMPSRSTSTPAFCQYITYLENELRSRGADIVRPKHVSDAMRVNAIRESIVDSGDEKSIIDSLSETAIKTIMNR